MVFTRMSSMSQPCASTASPVVSPTTDGLSGIPIAGGFARTCAPSGALQIAITHGTAKLQRFHLAKAPSTLNLVCTN